MILRLFLLCIFLAGATSIPATAADWEIGARATLVTAGGEPANDITGAGLYLRYPLSANSRLGFALDYASGDFETPANILGLTTVGVIDSTAEWTALSAWYEYLLGKPEDAWRWFVGAGLGVAFVEVKDVSGPLAGGGSFDITTDADDEILALFSAGLRRRFGARWSGEVALRVDHHFADWQMVDRVSGRSGEIDDYTAIGGYLGFSYRF